MDKDNEIISFENLYKSLQRTSRGVSWKDSVASYKSNGLKNTYKLRQDLINDTYKIGKYHVFEVTDPKRREVMATGIRDRQVQDSLCKNYFYDCVVNSLIRDNYACQVGRGVDDALNRLEVQLRRYYRSHGSNGYVLKCDVHHYFAETKHSVAKSVVRRICDDDDAIVMVDQIIDSFPGDKGIGLGSPVSQLIELAVVDEMDHFIKERLRIKHYVRYMDDFILIHQDKEYLQYCLSEIRKHLAKIGLELNKKTALFPISQGITFLKWRFKLTDTGKVIRLIGQRSITKERRKLRKLSDLVANGERHVQDAVNSFMAWAASVERNKTTKNMERRSCGLRAYDGYNAKYVEMMRDYFRELFCVDPYSLDAANK